jgi:hypothetical protein
MLKDEIEIEKKKLKLEKERKKDIIIVNNVM